MTAPGTDVDGHRSTRRRWIVLCGTAGLSGVGGCLGAGDDDGDAADGTDGTEDSAGQTGADENGGTGETSQSLQPEDGWGRPHDGVAVPDESGKAVLRIGGERVEMDLLGSATERPEGAGMTGAETFEATATGQNTTFRDSGLQVECTRVLGVTDTAGVWAESDAISFTRPTDNRRLGNVIYRLFDDGRYADAASAGELDGRRFVEESFMRVTTEGVITAVETLSSHEDETLNGEFEFGARLQDGWDQ